MCRIPFFTARLAARAATAAAALALATTLLPGSALAQAWPARPIKLIVPFPPAGSTDVAGRVLTQAMAPALGQTFVVENRAGAAGALGMDLVAKAPPDGYTLGVGGVGALVTIELLGRKLPYQVDKDLVPVAHMGSLALAIVARSGLKAGNLAEMVAMAKSQPGKLSYGSSGIGSPGHLAFEHLKGLAGVFMVHIPYRGDSALATDVLGGQVDIGVLTVPAAIAQASNGGVRILAVTGAKRSEQLPQVPTVAESGLAPLAKYEAEIWNVLVAPAGTPSDVVERLNAGINAALRDAGVRKQLAGQGIAAAPMSAKETADFLRRERVKWAEVVKRSGATLD